MLNDSSPRKSLPVLAVGKGGKAETQYVAPVDLGAWAYDVRLAGQPLQCNSTDGTCDEMRCERTKAEALQVVY